MSSPLRTNFLSADCPGLCGHRGDRGKIRRDSDSVDLLGIYPLLELPISGQDLPGGIFKIDNTPDVDVENDVLDVVLPKDEELTGDIGTYSVRFAGTGGHERGRSVLSGSALVTCTTVVLSSFQLVSLLFTTDTSLRKWRKYLSMYAKPRLLSRHPAM